MTVRQVGFQVVVAMELLTHTIMVYSAFCTLHRSPLSAIPTGQGIAALSVCVFAVLPHTMARCLRELIPRLFALVPIPLYSKHTCHS